jgi:hypothetical protein
MSSPCRHLSTGRAESIAKSLIIKTKAAVVEYRHAATTVSLRDNAQQRHQILRSRPKQRSARYVLESIDTGSDRRVKPFALALNATCSSFDIVYCRAFWTLPGAVRIFYTHAHLYRVNCDLTEDCDRVNGTAFRASPLSPIA